MDIQIALFDLDGTLIDSMGMWKRIDEKFLSIRGIPVPTDYQMAIATMRIDEAAKYTINRFALKDTPEQLKAEWMSMAKREYEYNISLKPGAKQYLELLNKKGVRLGTFTSLTRELFEPVLKRNGVYELFDSLTSSVETPLGKAYKESYAWVAQKMGATPDKCVMYDDIPQALRAARAAGMSTVGVYDLNGHADMQELKEASDRVILSFEDELIKPQLV